MQDKIICDYCGTIYPAASHKCPICGNVYDPDVDQAPEVPASKHKQHSTDRRSGPVSAASFFGIHEDEEPERKSAPVVCPEPTVEEIPAAVEEPEFVDAFAALTFDDAEKSKDAPAAEPVEPAAPEEPAAAPAAPAKPVPQPKPVQQTPQPQPEPTPSVKPAPQYTQAPKKPAAAAPEPAKAPEAKNAKRKRTVTTGAVVALIILLVAVIGVGIFIWTQFQREFDPTPLMAGQVTAPTQVRGGENPCTGLRITNTTVTLNDVGSSVLLDVKPSPADTTDDLSFASADPTIAEVNADGLVTAVGPGTVRITVICGAVQSTCTIQCEFEDPNATTEPEDTTEPKETEDTLSLSHQDVTLFEEGESFLLSLGSYANVQVTWSSEDESVATVSNGKVTAVGEGKTIIHAEIDGQDFECIVRCNFG